MGHLPESVSAFVALLAEMPLVESEMITEVVACYRSGTSDQVVSRYGEEIAPPLLYGRVLFAELRGVTGDVGGKPVIRRLLDSAVVVEWPEDLTQDVDIAEDVERIRDRQSDDSVRPPAALQGTSHAGLQGPGDGALVSSPVFFLRVRRPAPYGVSKDHSGTSDF